MSDNIEYIDGPYSASSESGWVQEVGYAIDLETGKKGVVVVFKDATCFYPGASKSYVREIENSGGHGVHATVYGMSYNIVHL